MYKCIFFIAAIGVVGFFLIFHRHRINTVLLILLAVYGIGAGQRLLTSPATDELTSTAFALVGLGLLWVIGWLSIKYYESRRR